VVSNPRASLETKIAQSTLADALFLEIGKKAGINRLRAGYGVQVVHEGNAVLELLEQRLLVLLILLL